MTLDFWQADSAGNYDDAGYRLRGHQLTASNGGYHLETIIPGVYPTRSEHIHVKVEAPGNPILTTQLFFPGVARNQSDAMYTPSLEIAISDGTDGGKQGTYDFIVG